MTDNTLYYGDNLEILGRFVPDESVDLVYLDPPFSSNPQHNIIFRDESGRKSDAQIVAFEEIWHWGPTPALHYEYLTNSARHLGKVPHAVSSLVAALDSSIGPSPLLAYLVEMAVRLVELRRVMKANASLYLHCDPTASHYLKVILDAIFGARQFRNEITWQRATAHNMRSKAWARVNDTLLFYSKSDAFTFHQLYTDYGPAQLRRYRADSDGRLYKAENLTFSTPNPLRQFEWRGVKPPPNRSWGASLEQLEKLYADGRILLKRDGTPRLDGLKVYLDETKGKPVSTNWTDIPRVGNTSRERLGYPTQKPVALLERIIAASSDPGDVVLDPFCGCGTALEAAQRLDRRWVGIDISNRAVEVIGDRMKKIGVDVEIVDWPTEVEGVRRMAEAPGGRHRFEAWALTMLHAQPVRVLGGRGADQGIDGRIVFTGAGGKLETIIVSVKSGGVGSGAVRDLKGTMQREHAAMGLVFTLQEPTAPMRKEAATAGFYRSPIDGRRYPRIVIHTVRELLEEHRLPELPIRYGVQPELGLEVAAAAARRDRIAAEEREAARAGEEARRRRERVAAERREAIVADLEQAGEPEEAPARATTTEVQPSPAKGARRSGR